MSFLSLLQDCSLLLSLTSRSCRLWRWQMWPGPWSLFYVTVADWERSGVVDLSDMQLVNRTILSGGWTRVSAVPLLNPLTLRVSLEGIVSYFHTFKNNSWIKQKFTKYLRESCCLASNQHFSFKCFQENAFLSKIFPKSSGLFWLLWV